MGPNVAFLLVVTKDLPISPRITPPDFLSRCKFTTRQSMVDFYLITHVLSLSATEERTQILVVRIELTTSALIIAGVQVTYYYRDHSGNGGLNK